MPSKRSSFPPEPESHRESQRIESDDPATPVAPDVKPTRSSLFAAHKHTLGWQGYTLTLPSDWNMAQFGGNYEKGTMRIDDGDGPRIELRWETPPNAIDLEKSIENFVSRLAREAKKKKTPFQPADHPHIVSKSRKQKAQLVNFGWTGDHNDTLAAHGWGTAWQCDTCKRVVVAHLIGRGREKPRAVQQLTTDIFTSMECHGRGGWQSWSVFGLSVEIPTEFTLSRAKLQTGRLEIEWERPLPGGLKGWQARPERIVLRRLAAANVLLENESLEQWAQRVLIFRDKRTTFGAPEETVVHSEEGLLFPGAPRHFRQRAVQGVREKVFHQGVPQARLYVWHSEPTNKILVLETELTPQNGHVIDDVLDSLEYE